MPIYEYACEHCGHKKEEIVLVPNGEWVDSYSLIDCLKCGHHSCSRKVPSVPARGYRFNDISTAEQKLSTAARRSKATHVDGVPIETVEKKGLDSIYDDRNRDPVVLERSKEEKIDRLEKFAKD